MPITRKASPLANPKTEIQPVEQQQGAGIEIRSPVAIKVTQRRSQWGIIITMPLPITINLQNYCTVVAGKMGGWGSRWVGRLIK